MSRKLNIILALLILAGNVAGRNPESNGINCSGYIRIKGKTNIQDFELLSLFENAGWAISGPESNPSDNIYRLSIPVNSFSGNSPHLEKDFRILLQSDQHPLIWIGFHNQVDSTLQPGTFLKDVEISIAGHTRVYEIPCEIISSDEHSFYIRGSRQIPISDFKLNPPTKLLGLVRVKEFIHINFCVSFTLSSNLQTVDRIEIQHKSQVRNQGDA